jgi:hypothetical protein
MSSAVTVRVEQKDDTFWPYVQRSAGELPATPLHGVVKWILEQMNFGNLQTERDSRGDVVSLTIGKAAATELVSDDEALENAKRRLLAVNAAGLFAQSRESGIAPAYAHISKMGNRRTGAAGTRNSTTPSNWSRY